MRETNRGLAWPFLEGLPLGFLNVNQAVKWLQGQGVGYHFQTMWHDVRTAFDRHDKKPLQETFSGFDRLPQKLFIEKDWRRPESYYYYGNIYKKDMDTGEIYRHSYSLYADTSLSDAELTDMAYAIEDEKEEGTPPKGDVIAFEALESFHKWGAPRSEGYGIAEI